MLGSTSRTVNMLSSTSRSLKLGTNLRDIRSEVCLLARGNFRSWESSINNLILFLLKLEFIWDWRVVRIGHGDRLWHARPHSFPGHFRPQHQHDRSPRYKTELWIVEQFLCLESEIGPEPPSLQQAVHEKCCWRLSVQIRDPRGSEELHEQVWPHSWRHSHRRSLSNFRQDFQFTAITTKRQNIFVMMRFSSIPNPGPQLIRLLRRLKTKAWSTRYTQTP